MPKNFTLDRPKLHQHTRKFRNFLWASSQTSTGETATGNPFDFPVNVPQMSNRNRRHCNALPVHFWCLCNAPLQKDVIQLELRP